MPWVSHEELAALERALSMLRFDLWTAFGALVVLVGVAFSLFLWYLGRLESRIASLEGRSSSAHPAPRSGVDLQEVSAER